MNSTSNPPSLYARLLALDAQDKFCAILLAIGTAMLATALAYSLAWEGFWDSVYLHHFAYLTFVKGLAPYKDFFDINMFGIYVLHGLMGAIFGYNDIGLRLWDITWLLATCLLIYLIMAKIDWRAGWFAAILFGWIYINQGEMQLLQREYLMQLPILAAVLLVTSPAVIEKRRWLRALLIGILYGSAVTIKPNGFFTMPVLLIFETQCFINQEEPIVCWRRIQAFIFSASFAVLGAVLPMCAGLAWLWQRGSLEAFMEVIVQYWPLYSKMTFKDGVFYAQHQPWLHESRWDLLTNFKNFDNKQWLIVPAIGASAYRMFRAETSKETKKIIVLILMLFASGIMQALVIGYFHPYSWMHALVYLVMAFGLCFLRDKLMLRTAFNGLYVLGIVTFLWMACNRMNPNWTLQLSGKKPTTPWSARVSELNSFFRLNIEPGDKVQVIDALGGTQKALLESDVEIATPIVVDTFITLFIKNSFVQKLRVDFMNRLKNKPPKYIVLVFGRRLICRDEDDRGELEKEFSIWVKANYQIVHTGKGYTIYRND